jgi:protein disulfide-isomerase A1
MKLYNVRAPAIILFKKIDNEKIVFKSKFSAEKVDSFIKENFLSLLDDFDMGNHDMYLERKIPIAYFFYNNVSQKTEFEPVLKELARKFQKKLSFVFIDSYKVL